MTGAGAGARRLPDTFESRVAGRFAGLRAELSRRVGLGLAHDPRSAALNRAILLGERAALDRALRDDFAAAGTIHVFAISGLHVMLIARFLLTALLLCRLPLRAAAAAAVPALWFYVCLIGLPPSAVRAALMATFHFSACLLVRRPSLLRAWALTFLLVHALSPRLLLDVGCRLSFTIVLAIVAWLRFGPQRQEPLPRACALAVAVWAAGVPMTARVFARFTPGALLANPPALVLAECGLFAGLAGVLASFASERLAEHVNNFAALCTRAMADLSSLAADLPFASFEIAPWSPGMCAAWYAACVLALWLARARERRRETRGWLAT